MLAFFLEKARIKPNAIAIDNIEEPYLVDVGLALNDETLGEGAQFAGTIVYMSPEQAARGLELFEKIGDDNPDQESSGTCKDLSKLPYYNENY